MNRYSTKQKGLTFISILVILLVVGFFTYLIMKIGPIYYNNFQLKKALASLKREGAMETYSREKILGTVHKRLDSSYLDDIIRPEDIEIVKTPNYVSVTIDYEVTRNIYANLDVLVYFTEKYEAGSR